MADSTHHQSGLPKPERHSSDKLLPSFDKMIEHNLKDLGWMQFMQAFLVSLSYFFDAQQTFISLYTDAEPTWHCTNNSACNSSFKTIISEWGLEYSSSVIKRLPVSAYFFGSLVGGFFLATLANLSLGRKKLLFLSCLTMSITALVTTLSTNVWIYSIFRFISGVGRASIGTCAIVLLTEKVERKWRGIVGIMDFYLFTLGMLSLPAIAYINRGSSWRAIYLWTSIPTIFYTILVHFFVSESPRWLSMQGSEEEARSASKSISLVNNRRLSTCVGMSLKQKSSKINFYSPMKNLYEKGWTFERLLAVTLLGIGICMVYIYGFTVGVKNLSYNIYSSVVFNALLELRSYVVAFFVIEGRNRKGSLIVYCIASGIFSTMTCILGNGQRELQLGLKIALFYSAFMVYNVILIDTIELFPTFVWNSATSIVKQALIFGAIFSPLFVSAVRNNVFLLYGVFGLVVLYCGFFVFSLSETMDAADCDAMDEQENGDCSCVK